MEVLAWLQRDDVVGWISSQSGIKLRKTPGYDTFNQALCLDLPLATLLKVTFSKVAAYGTLVTNHQHDSMGFSKDRQPLSDRITLAETKQVVIEKHHSDNLRAVFSIFKLRQDHRCQFEGAGHVGGKDVGNFHETCISIGVSF